MKFLKVNMTNGTIEIQQVSDGYEYLGGRGLTSIMINAEVPPDCDPLGPENKLIFAPGYLSGTSLINTSRLSIGAKSPLTGGIKESNVGGTISGVGKFLKEKYTPALTLLKQEIRIMTTCVFEHTPPYLTAQALYPFIISLEGRNTMPTVGSMADSRRQRPQ